MNVKYKSLKKCAGFNALELMMVLAVIAVATVAVVKTMSGNSDKQSSTQMVTDVTAMVFNIKNAYSNSNDGYNTLTQEAVIKMKAIPQDLRVNGETIKSQFQGGTVEIAATADTFTITYTQVPQAVCASAVNALGGSAFSSIKINDDEVFNNVNKNLDPSLVAKDCENGKAPSKIEFTAS